MSKRTCTAALLFIFIAGFAYGQKYSKGHPGYKRKQRKKTKRFARQTKKAVKKVQQEHAGTFPLDYRKVLFFNKQLQLKLTKVHKKKFYKMNDSVAFICANFIDADSVLYDVDIFMKRPKGAKKYKVITDRIVHKVNRYPLFSWYSDDGQWHRCRMRDNKFIDQAKKGNVKQLDKQHASPPKKQIKSKKLSRRITKQIMRVQRNNGGYYPVELYGTAHTMKLKMTKVHKNDHFTVNDTIAAICADFVDDEGLSYDVDIWVTRNGGRYNKITKKVIHKVEGHPLYAWYNDAGVWKKCSIRTLQEAKGMVKE